MINNKIKDITGNKYHMLTAIGFAGLNKKRNALWLFKCDCGNEKILSSGNVIRSKSPTKSCGCLQDSIFKYKGLQALQNAVYTGNKYNEADITFEQFMKLSQKDCHYCGSCVEYSGKTVKNDKYVFTYHGLDRKDNYRIHTLDNCVPCCWKCNWAKGKMNYQEFIEWITCVYNRRIK